MSELLLYLAYSKLCILKQVLMFGVSVSLCFVGPERVMKLSSNHTADLFVNKTELESLKKVSK
jgi:hypothetical protein